MQLVAHDAAVKIGGSQWQACIEIDGLVLSNTIMTNDKKEQTVNRIANIRREVEGRQQELEALVADLGVVEAECEEVSEEEDGKRWGGEEFHIIVDVCVCVCVYVCV